MVRSARLCRTAFGSVPASTARRLTRTTVALTTSMAESRPKATNATEPARRVSQVQGPVVAVARTARTVVRLQRGPAARSGSGVVGRRGAVSYTHLRAH